MGLRVGSERVCEGSNAWRALGGTESEVIVGMWACGHYARRPTVVKHTASRRSTDMEHIWRQDAHCFECGKASRTGKPAGTIIASIHLDLRSQTNQNRAHAGGTDWLTRSAPYYYLMVSSRCPVCTLTGMPYIHP